MSFWIPIASFFMGLFAYVLSSALGSLVTGGRIPKSHKHYRDRILELLHYLLNLKAEVADVEQELVELWEKAPDKQARLIATNSERAAMLPPAIHAIARRYGFSAPDAVEPPPEPPVKEVDKEEDGEMPSSGANVIAWTGRRAAGE